jgi:2,5-diketo-D-gluconate reductase B
VDDTVTPDPDADTGTGTDAGPGRGELPSMGLPPLGLGTWDLPDGTCAEVVADALELGYRHVDTAQLYGNERAVGEGLRRVDVPRESVVLATKVDPEALGYEDVLASTRESLDRLGLESVDLLYVHWPRAAYDAERTLAAFTRLVDEGFVGDVGVSNFTPDLLDEAREHVDVAVHQVEMHPLCPQERLREYAAEGGHALVAYSPLARGRALDLEPVRAVAERHDATPAQVCLAWLRERGAFPIPKTTGGHLEENYRSLGLDLAERDVARIDAVDRRERVVDPPSAPWNRG